jgi:hypothetical protein
MADREWRWCLLPRMVELREVLAIEGAREADGL